LVACCQTTTSDNNNNIRPAHPRIREELEDSHTF
jgi:hypothetical protein